MRLLTVSAGGYNGTALGSGCEFFARAIEDWTPTARGTEWVWAARVAGTTSLANLFNVRSPSVGVVEFTSGGNLFRLISGSTGIAFRDSTNAADTFTVNAAGTAIEAALAVTFRLPSATEHSIASGGAYYFGAAATDGTWRITRSGNDLVIQRRESGSYVTKSTISA